MFQDTQAFSSFSVDDIAAAKQFYSEALGLVVEGGDMGTLALKIVGNGDVLVYPKGDQHEPASFTILNFPVDDIESKVAQLKQRGVEFEQLDGVDDDGISRQGGPLIAWFKDPAGNFLSVIQVD